MLSKGNWRRPFLPIAPAVAAALAASIAWAADPFRFEAAGDAFGYHQTFAIDPARKSYPCSFTLIESNAAGNVFHPAEQPKFTVQIQNLTAAPIRCQGRMEVIRYGGRGRPGAMWVPEFYSLGRSRAQTVEVDVAAGGWQNLTLAPQTPETMGGYGLVIDLGAHGRQVATHYIRTFQPAAEPVQYPKQALENMPPEILHRLGVHAIRYGVRYEPSDSPKYAEFLAWLDEEFNEMHRWHVTAVAEIGAGGAPQPLGRGRPHLDENGVMKDGKMDLVWLPECDDDYQEFVYRLACQYGWPKGPITGFMLWNEPWEGLSISGWGADMIRYRELYKRMGDAVFQARKDAGVDVLVGGCDSSTNTWDKLFPDGSGEFLPYLDFCSIHYQGLSSPVLYPQWNHRTHYKGRVLIWDTESWVANTDDRFAGVAATNRAAGYDRSMGIRGSNVASVLSHHRVAYDTIQTHDGPQRIARPLVTWPAAAAVAAVQHFLGERQFREILFQTGLPWVYVFDGLDGNEDDGTVVVVGDIAALFAEKKGGSLFRTVRCRDEVAAKQQIQTQLAALGAGAAQERAELQRRLDEPMAFTGAAMTLDAAAGRFGLFDFYGNPVPAVDGKIVVPLDSRGFFLRATGGRPGSFAALIDALRAARIDGIEPLEMIAFDMTAPIESGPSLRLQLTSMLNHPVAGRFSVRLGELAVDAPAALSFRPRERKTLELRVRGEPSPENVYPLSLVFDAGGGVVAVHDEPMHVNWISRRTIRVDGTLDDWEGTLPQIIQSGEAASLSFTEAMWMPFEKSTPGAEGGFAVGRLAYDGDYFYFSAKVADDTPHPGTIRFETRDHDADFYPEVSYSYEIPKRQKRDQRGRDAPPPAPQEPPAAQLEEHRWPEGVRRFSYRRWPALPSGHSKCPIDNVLVAFNAIEAEEEEWLAHLPGRMFGFIWYKCTDYEFALNRVADEYGGATEIWKLQVPGMPRKQFYPRQPAWPGEGPVAGGKLAIVHAGGTRITEAAIPWSAIPHVKERLDAGENVKFSFRVNHDALAPSVELARGRSVSKSNSQAFHPNWDDHWANELEFGFERLLSEFPRSAGTPSAGRATSR